MNAAMDDQPKDRDGENKNHVKERQHIKALLEPIHRLKHQERSDKWRVTSKQEIHRAARHSPLVTDHFLSGAQPEHPVAQSMPKGSFDQNHQSREAQWNGCVKVIPDSYAGSGQNKSDHNP